MKKVQVGIIVAACSIIGIGGVSFGAYKLVDNHAVKYYQDKFLPGTYINGTDCSNMSVAKAKDALQKQVESYSLELKERDNKSEVITGAQLGLKYIDDGSVDKLMESQNPILWKEHMNTETNNVVDAAYSYDESYIPYLVEELNCVDETKVTKPADAYIAENDQGFYIVPEVKGNQVDEKVLTDLVKTAVKESASSIDLEAGKAYLEPKILENDTNLVKRLDDSNKLLNADITFDFKDRWWHADKETIKGWLIKNPDGSYAVDETKVKQWVDNMAYETDTFGLSRDFMTSFGVPITLEGGGDYGWYMDTEETAAKLIQELYLGSVKTMEPVYIYEADDRATNDIGGTYVEICISTQTMWAYVDGQLLCETPVITGCLNKGTSTPSGSVWAIDAKKEDWEFTTFPGAFSQWWMPFNDQCGIHDASWQPANSYTPTTYISGGSHGCVNTPDIPAEMIFNNFEIGDPVVVYYSLEQVHGPDPTEDLVAG